MILMALAIIAIIALVINGFRQNMIETKNIFKDNNANKASKNEYSDEQIIEDIIEEKSIKIKKQDQQLSFDLSDVKTFDASEILINHDVSQFDLFESQPDLNETILIERDATEEVVIDESKAIESTVEPEIKSQILRIYLQASSNTLITNQILFGILNKNHLQFDQNSRFFIRYDSFIRDKILFKICNMSDTGVFDDVDVFSKINGIVLFMTIPSDQDEDTLKKMSETAHSVATVLNAKILDENLHPFDKHSYQLYQNKIKQLS